LARHPIEAQDVANAINYVTGSCGSSSTSVCYSAFGSVEEMTNGTNLYSTYLYNTRLQPCWMYATTGTALATNTSCTASDSTPGNILDLQYNFHLGSGDNGNVMGITNNRDTTRTQSFTYDQVNRIATGQTSSTTGGNCWGESYTLDQWANLTTIGAVSGYTGCTQENLSVTATANNQLSATGFSYDASGNMLADGANSYTYNAESEIITAAGVTYRYDGDGNRLLKSTGKAYWYGAGSEILDESDLANITDEYVFFRGKRIAHRSVSSGTIYYYEEDMLGSSRTIVQAGQTSPCYDSDFYPYGGERAITNTCAQNYKFEGKERDTETGNVDFGARYYSSRLGRWLSADWSSVPAPVPYANLANPQTLNLYAMVSDNPESFADLDGHQCSTVNSTTCVEGPNGSGVQPASSNGVKQTASQTCGGGSATTPGTGCTTDQTNSQSNNPTQAQKDEDSRQQALKQREQQIINAQAAPALGSPEYIAKVAGQVSAETDAAKKYILAPAAVLEGVGLGIAIGGPAAATTMRTTVAIVATHPDEASDFAKGFAAPKGAPPPISPAGIGGRFRSGRIGRSRIFCDRQRRYG
jgi:RHS repeat-associated protein